MDIASRFAHVNRPMIVSSTAHYSKFAYDVLRGLGQFPSSHDPGKLFANLRMLGPLPAMHSNLEVVVNRPQLHNAKCEADVNAIMNEIQKFLNR